MYSWCSLAIEPKYFVDGPGIGSAHSAYVFLVPKNVIVSPSTTRSAFCRAASAISGLYSSQFCRGDFPRGRKWIVASRTLRGTGAGTSLNETLLHWILPRGAHKRCNSTTARVAFAGA